MQVATFRGIIPSFVNLYAKSLGARVKDGEMVGDGWKAEIEYRKVRIGSLKLTEVEMRFEGNDEAISKFLAQFRMKILRNWG